MTDLDARYGRNKRNSRRNVITLAVLLAVVFFGWALSVNFFTPAEHASFSGDSIAYSQHTDTRIVARLKMSGGGVTGLVHCTAKALDDSYAIVGFKEFDTRFAGEQEKSTQIEINTVAKASSVVVESCSLK